MGAMLVRHEPRSVADVRREIAADLREHGVTGQYVDDITLVASELVGNAVRHAVLDGHLDVAWTILPGSILVSVADSSEQLPCLRAAAADEPGGRGLAIVDMLSTGWGVEPRHGGKRVWARLSTR